ncbi:hypothetical protein A4V12_20960 [Streptomyces noursei]|nr:hypothetical protein A4V12_20960 [Streptomyces noursei]
MSIRTRTAKGAGGVDRGFDREPGGTLNSMTTGGTFRHCLTDALGPVVAPLSGRAPCKRPTVEASMSEQAAIWFPSGTAGIVLLTVAIVAILVGTAMGRSRRRR